MDKASHFCDWLRRWTVDHSRTNKIVDNCRLITAVASNKAQNSETTIRMQQPPCVPHCVYAACTARWSRQAKNSAWKLSNAHSAITLNFN